jgi:hypothetical protein
MRVHTMTVGILQDLAQSPKKAEEISEAAWVVLCHSLSATWLTT